MAETIRDRAGRLLPTGDCWCGCGAETTAGNFFAPGHDKFAEAAVINLRYGSVAGVPGRARVWSSRLELPSRDGTVARGRRTHAVGDVR